MIFLSTAFLSVSFYSWVHSWCVLVLAQISYQVPLNALLYLTLFTFKVNIWNLMWYQKDLSVLKMHCLLDWWVCLLLGNQRRVQSLLVTNFFQTYLLPQTICTHLSIVINLVVLDTKFITIDKWVQFMVFNSYAF